ncbi:cation:proton antiporter [Thiohalorhabdus sp. Cl-TMA]|uniref:Cation:proton antiporter n=1 Tax=Thiohalorhabdus methylotrophus TaxID=3242694 RepID=A0ABV4TVF0_9GAMM
MENHLELALMMVVVLGLSAQWLAWRFNLPAIVIMIAAGLLAGPVLGLIQPDQQFGHLLTPVVGLAVAVILFEDAFSFQLHEVRHTARGVLRLITLGVLLTWAFGTVAAHYLAGLSWSVATALGAILVTTGPTVVGPLLRQARLKMRPASFLKWEGIINDPIGALLAILTFEYLLLYGNDNAVLVVVQGLAIAMATAGVVGGGGGYLLGRAIARGWMPEYLKAPGMLGAVLLVYAVANLFQKEAGLLATTVMGVVMANMGLASTLELRRFKGQVVVFLVSGLFVVLTADLDPETLMVLDAGDALFVAAMILLVRPAAVMLATIRTQMSWQERLLVAFVGPRGIVTAAMAGIVGPSLAGAGFADAREILPLVFSVILATVLFHGFTVGPLARKLNLVAARRDGVLIVGAHGWTLRLATLLRELEVPVTLADSSWHRLRPARMAGIRTQSGELLSDLGQERLDLTGTGYLLAATDNDAYNALLCTQLSPELGRGRVFQLAPSREPEKEARTFSRTFRGQVAFSEEATFDRMMERHYLGWELQKTRLTEEFSYDDFLHICPVNAENLLLVRENGMVVFNSPEQPLEPETGDTLVCYRPGRQEHAQPRLATGEASGSKGRET